MRIQQLVYLEKIAEKKGAVAAVALVAIVAMQVIEKIESNE